MKKIILLILITFNTYGKNDVIRDSVKMLLNEHKLSKQHKRLLLAQAMFESGHFSDYKWNNVYGRMVRVYDKKKHRWKYRTKYYNSLRECVQDRVNLFISSGYKIRKDYATDKNYFKELNKIVKKVK